MRLQGRNLLMLAVLACLTPKDLWNTACETGCRRDGHDGGHYAEVNKKPACVCEDIYEAERIVGKRLRLPSRPRKSSRDSGIDLNMDPSRWQEPKLED